MVEFLGPKRGTDSPTRLVLNQVGEAKKSEIGGADFKNALAIEPSASIPYDGDAFGQALNAGDVVCVASPKSKASLAIRELTAVVGGCVEAEKKKSGFLGGLFAKGKKKA